MMSDQTIPPATTDDLELDLSAAYARCELATPPPWRWWTSNSFRRLMHSANGRDHSVIHPLIGRDKHPDLIISREDMDLVEHARLDLPAAIRLVAHWRDVAEHWKGEAERLSDEHGEPLIPFRTLCVWHGPDGQRCAAPWTTKRTGDRLCSRHAAIVELAREPIRPAADPRAVLDADDRTWGRAPAGEA